MSRYSEKHRTKARCAVKTCDESGTALKVQFGKLDWWCEVHSSMDQSDQRSA